MTSITQWINRIAVAILATAPVAVFAAAPDAPEFLMHKANAKFKVSSQGAGEIDKDTIKTQNIINLIMDRDLDAKSVKDEQLGLVTACAAAEEVEASALVVYNKKTDEVLSLPARAIIFDMEAGIIEFDKHGDPKKGELLASIEDESVVDGFLTMSGSTNYGKIGKKVADGTWNQDAICIKKFKSKSITGASFIGSVVMSGKISASKAQFAGDAGLFPEGQMAISKTATSISNGLDVVTAPDDIINYAIVVTNIGGLQLTNVQVNDTNITLSCDGGQFDGVLDPDETVTCTGSNTVSIEEFDVACAAEGTGTIHNIATTTSDETDSFAANEIVDVECFEAPPVEGDEMSIVKTATSAQPVHAGDTIEYDIDVTSLDTTLLTGVTVTDLTPGITIDCGNFDGTLSLFEKVTCTGSYTVSVADVEFACDERNGTIRNIAAVDSNQTASFFADELVDVACP